MASTKLLLWTNGCKYSRSSTTSPRNCCNKNTNNKEKKKKRWILKLRFRRHPSSSGLTIFRRSNNRRKVHPRNKQTPTVCSQPRKEFRLPSIKLGFLMTRLLKKAGKVGGGKNEKREEENINGNYCYAHRRRGFSNLKVFSNAYRGGNRPRRRHGSNNASSENKGRTLFCRNEKPCEESEERGVAVEELWKKRILMGRRCRFIPQNDPPFF